VGFSCFQELKRVGFEFSSAVLSLKSESRSFDVEGETRQRKRRGRRRTGRKDMPSGEGLKVEPVSVVANSEMEMELEWRYYKGGLE
jgi:hypothetical protein